ncbi:MAG: hypothetical protein VX259_06945, partial [Pseudomonadota bacterium]|nr:hypothetical protein [Pseudomonadota bacterium]
MAHSLRALGAALLGVVSPLVMAAGIDMHKDPHCGCCSAWADHVRAAGFEVSVLEEADMGAVKRELGVPMALASCHTAVLTTDAGKRY